MTRRMRLALIGSFSPPHQRQPSCTGLDKRWRPNYQKLNNKNYVAVFLFAIEDDSAMQYRLSTRTFENDTNKDKGGNGLDNPIIWTRSNTKVGYG